MNKKSKILFFSMLLLSVGAIQAFASTNIDATYYWAWNDNIGWIDYYSTGNVNVYNDRLEGYAVSSEIGNIALNCNSTPNGNICATSNFKVANDGNGYLSGWAWNDAIGWISFDSVTANSPYVYQVSISAASGTFSGWAWNDVIGWINFNCNDLLICSTSNYTVKTSWRNQGTSGSLASSIFDTGVTSGATLNTIMWQGNKPSETVVKFQIASSNSSGGPWTYIGPDGSGTSFYTPTDANIPVQINPVQHNSKRYFRYKIILESNAAQTASPRVDDVIINWSP